VQKILDYINYGQIYNTNLRNVNVLKNKSKYLSFKGWDIIIREKVEFIAGNYRVKVLKEYLHCLKSLENKRW
jgi:hypothetical protein